MIAALIASVLIGYVAGKSTNRAKSFSEIEKARIEQLASDAFNAWMKIAKLDRNHVSGTQDGFYERIQARTAYAHAMLALGNALGIKDEN